MDNVRDHYAPIAEFYDLEHDELTDDVEFYQQYVESIGDPVLELACGSGRIAVPIAEMGYRVTGADISTPMLDRARERAANAEVRVSLINADMASAHNVPGGPYGVVIMALGALSHLTTLEEQVQALSSARRALDPRGALLIDVMHAAPHRLMALDGSHALDGTWITADGTTVQRFSHHVVFPASQTIETQIWYDRTTQSGSVTRHVMRLTQRYLGVGELRLMLDAAGFQDALFYGGYGLEPFDDSAERMIVVAEATKT